MTGRDWIGVEFEFELDDERWAVVEANVWPDVPARRSGHPDTWEPAEPGHVEIERVTLHHCEHDETRELVGRALSWWARGREAELEEEARRAAGDAIGWAWR